MKFIIIAVVFQMLFAILLDLIYVKFDLFKFGNSDDILYWLLNVVITLPLYVKGYFTLYKNKVWVIILTMLSFIVMTMISLMAMIFFHGEVLNAPK